MPLTSYKTVILAPFLAVFACSLCAGQVVTHDPPAVINFLMSGLPVRKPTSQNLDNQPVDAVTIAMTQSKSSKDDKKKPSSGAEKQGGKTPATDKPAAQPTGEWVLVLGTYSEDGHDQAARTMLDGLRQIAPEIARNSRVHVGSKGSMVVYGHYTNRDDPNAKDDQERLKKVLYKNQPLFSRVIISRIDSRTMDSQFDPRDLLSVRQKYPKVDPLYTVDIAIWDDLGAGKMSYDDIRKKAVAYCEQLRAQGVEAYFYHDDENQRSTVTVGVFDRRAINETSRLFSPEVEAVMKKFPARLVNGEPLYEFKDKFHQKEKGVKPVPPKLALVPEL